ncbi:unnamed protein product [Closterium sp. Yama58-4]|nr:unnamed protein product [Closterium sp. Yama58-4]
MKRARNEKATSPTLTPPSFKNLPDELLTTILSMVAARASTPQDFLSCRLASSHLRRISLLPEILAVLPPPALACPAKNYSLAYRSFLSVCAAVGNAEAAFLLGMVDFYCLERVASGMKRLVQAAKAGHAAALHSLSVIHFNGSGLLASGAEGSGAAEGGGAAEGDTGRRKLRGNRKVGMGMLLCVAAAKAGHPDALRELGLCLQDGFGIKRSVAQGRLLLVEANLRELANSGDKMAAAMVHRSLSPCLTIQGTLTVIHHQPATHHQPGTHPHPTLPRPAIHPLLPATRLLPPVIRLLRATTPRRRQATTTRHPHTTTTARWPITASAMPWRMA